LSELRIGLRTFYRELDLINRCGLKIRHEAKLYQLVGRDVEPEGRLPFPDPQLTFYEMAELAKCPCAAGERLANLLADVIKPPEPRKKRSGKNGKTKKRG
jgi:hypothetical protein